MLLENPPKNLYKIHKIFSFFPFAAFESAIAIAIALVIYFNSFFGLSSVNEFNYS
jgi:hypothetical protein